MGKVCPRQGIAPARWGIASSREGNPNAGWGKVNGRKGKACPTKATPVPRPPGSPALRYQNDHGQDTKVATRLRASPHSGTSLRSTPATSPPAGAIHRLKRRAAVPISYSQGVSSAACSSAATSSPAIRRASAMGSISSNSRFPALCTVFPACGPKKRR